MIKKTIFIAWMCLMVFCTSQAYEQRNLLQNHATEALIRRSLVMQQDTCRRNRKERQPYAEPRLVVLGYICT
ncbi:MAG: hypothetical protein HXN94_07205 [Prevotella salivae]|uniref:hypothetical protein n=1 Tax=Segatella salivae TaxID=228604 RepID=UPI001CB0DAD2|nr:hypothetical protein [Segatella salivae]MBF1524011.1 hypothetical protein [Segatella salivae]